MNSLNEKNRTFGTDFNYKAYYYAQIYDIEVDVMQTASNPNGSGTMCFKRMQLPQLIVQIWNSVLFTEMPVVLINEVEYPYNFNLEDMNIKRLAFGEVFVVPSVVDGEFQVEYFSDKERENQHAFKNGELIFLQYNKKLIDFMDRKGEEEYEFNHFINSEGFYQEDIKNKNKKTIFSHVFQVDHLLPFRMVQKNNVLDYEPIYANAINYINFLDDLFNYMQDDMLMSKKILFIPDGMLEYNDTLRTMNKTPQLNTKSNVFRLIPGDGNNTTPMDFQSNYEPQKYIDTINFYLHMVSHFCGFGARYLSYEKQTGVKTATEVTSSKDDIYKNKQFQEIEIEAGLKRLVQAKIYFDSLEQTLISLELITVQFSDAIIENEKEAHARYFADFTAGALDPVSYLKLSGYDDEIIQTAVDNLALLNSGNDTNSTENTINSEEDATKLKGVDDTTGVVNKELFKK